MKENRLQFVRRGETVSLSNVPPSRTLLEVLRENLRCTAVKEGCGEGDCGACTVVLAEAVHDHGSARLRYRAINSCIRLAHSAHGQALWTAEDLAGPGGALHPCQQAMLDHHGSQCGFCTPGFVMSLFGMYQNRVLAGETVDRATAQADLSGNLCRCTGYRPILDAAQGMGALPRVTVDEAAVLAQLRAIEPPDQEPATAPDYAAPTRLEALVRLRAARPQAQLVAGCTDVGLWVTKQHRDYAQVIDVTRVAELREIRRDANVCAIGAAVTLQDAFAALVADRPQLQRFAERFAGLPVRSSGSLGGNVANGSPIGDSMPLLLALDARLVLASQRGDRRVALDAFYTGYRHSVLAEDEIIAHIEVPLPTAAEHLRVYKLSKRQDDDISAVCLAVSLQVEAGSITRARIGAGGVAATPVRATETEAALQGRPWARATFEAAAELLAQEFTPLSDLRASADYRRAMLGRLLLRYWAEFDGSEPVHLEALA